MSSRFSRKPVEEVKAASSGNRLPYLKELVEMLAWPKNAQWAFLRPLEGLVPVRCHEYPIFKKDGTPVPSKYKGKDGQFRQATVSKVCLNNGDETLGRCPYCEAGLKTTVEYYMEVISDDEVEKEPTRHNPSRSEASTGFKDFDNDGSWTPVRVLKISARTLEKLQGLKQLNRVKKDGKFTMYSVDDPDYGCEIQMSFNPDAAGSDMYQIQKGASRPITEAEKAFLRWNIEEAFEKMTEKEGDADREVARFLKHTGGGQDDAPKAKPTQPKQAKAFPPLAVGDTVRLSTQGGDSYAGKLLEIASSYIVVMDDDLDEVNLDKVNIDKIEVVKPKSKSDTLPNVEEAVKQEDNEDNFIEPTQVNAEAVTPTPTNETDTTNEFWDDEDFQ